MIIKAAFSFQGSAIPASASPAVGGEDVMDDIFAKTHAHTQATAACWRRREQGSASPASWPPRSCAAVLMPTFRRGRSAARQTKLPDPYGLRPHVVSNTHTHTVHTHTRTHIAATGAAGGVLRRGAWLHPSPAGRRLLHHLAKTCFRHAFGRSRWRRPRSLVATTVGGASNDRG